MGEKVYLTAEQAREMMINSVKLKNYIYRNIKESATEGRCSLLWDFYEIDPGVREKILADLEVDGFKIEFNPYDDEENISDTVRISW